MPWSCDKGTSSPIWRQLPSLGCRECPLYWDRCGKPIGRFVFCAVYSLLVGFGQRALKRSRPLWAPFLSHFFSWHPFFFQGAIPLCKIKCQPNALFEFPPPNPKVWGAVAPVFPPWPVPAPKNPKVPWCRCSPMATVPCPFCYPRRRVSELCNALAQVFGAGGAREGEVKLRARSGAGAGDGKKNPTRCRALMFLPWARVFFPSFFFSSSFFSIIYIYIYIYITLREGASQRVLCPLHWLV